MPLASELPEAAEGSNNSHSQDHGEASFEPPEARRGHDCHRASNDSSECVFWLQQLSAMLYKNYIFLKRSWRMTALLIIAPFICISLLVLIDSFPQSGRRMPFSSLQGKFEEGHKVFEISAHGLPKCQTFNRVPCKTLRYACDAGVNETLAKELVSSVLAFSRLTSEDDSELVASAASLLHFIEKTPNATSNGLIFHAIDPHNFSYTILFNSSSNFRRLMYPEKYPDTRLHLQSLLDRSYIKYMAHRNATINMTLSTEEYPVNFNDSKRGTSKAFRRYSSSFYFAGLMLQYIFFLYNICQEKDLRLRQGLKMIGLRDSVYWVSWFITGLIISAIVTLVNIGSGHLYSVRYFVDTDLMVNVLLFFLFSLSILTMAFFTSTFIQSSKASVSVGVLSFVLGMLFVSITSEKFTLLHLYDMDSGGRWLVRAFNLFPPFNLAKGLSDINFHLMPAIDDFIPDTHSHFNWTTFLDSTRSYKRFTVPPAFSLVHIPACVQSVHFLLMNFLLFLILTWYFDNIIPGVNGKPLKPYYLFLPSYWVSVFGCGAKRPHHIPNLPKSDEANAVKLVVTNLKKTFYPSLFSRLFQCVSKPQKPIIAVNSLSLTLSSGQVFCLLGHNGAGKSTAISLLTGLVEADSGDAYICGYSVRDHMNEIRSQLGVCPQHDILWEELSAREHIRLFSVLKRVPVGERARVMQETLEWLDLSRVANRPVSTYSGGMKRRLSVGLAFMGNSKVVFLDEPTTGMDPLIRRQIWNMILSKSNHRLVFMTTHAMEEADLLASKIAIMGHGRVICDGSPVSLKNEHSGYIIEIYAPSAESYKRLLVSLKKVTEPAGCDITAHMKSHSEVHYSFKLPPSLNHLLTLIIQTLETFEESRLSFNVMQTTLEDTFINVTEGLVS